MSIISNEANLNKLTRDVVEGHKLVFWGLEIVKQHGNKVLRVFIDNVDKQITVDDCAKVSRQLSAVMDVEEPIADNYILEVSSPGVDRHIFTLDQYDKCVGQLACVHLRSSYEGRLKYTGVIKGTEGEEVVLVCNTHELLFPIECIKMAKVVPQF